MHYARLATLLTLLIGLGCASAQDLYERDAEADLFDFEDILEAREALWWKSDNAGDSSSSSSSDDAGAAADFSNDSD